MVGGEEATAVLKYNQGISEGVGGGGGVGGVGRGPGGTRARQESVKHGPEWRGVLQQLRTGGGGGVHAQEG